MAKERSVHKNQIILYQGEATAQYHVIREGIVRAYSILENGTEVIIAMHGPGDFFPSSTSVNSEAIFSVFYYETMTDVLFESYTIDEFTEVRKELIDGQPNYWSHRYLGALLHINALAQLTANKKLAHTLHYLAIRFGKELTGGVLIRIELKLTQQDIAALSSLSRETVNIELTKLKAQGLVTEKSKIYTVNLRALVKYIGDETLADVKI